MHPGRKKPTTNTATDEEPRAAAATIGSLPHEIHQKIAMHLLEGAYADHRRRLVIHTAEVSESDRRVREIRESHDFMYWGVGISEYLVHSDALVHAKDMRRQTVLALWRIISVLRKLRRGGDGGHSCLSELPLLGGSRDWVRPQSD